MQPDRLGPYTILRRLGRGGMGTVYLGVDEAVNQTAAVKLLSGDMAAHSDFRDRFRAEIETLRKLHHPNIVRIFGFGEQDDQIFYAMEYVSGSSLEAQLALGRPFQWREAAKMGRDIARALRHAHDRGVIHRDIKPGNLLLTEDGLIKLSDFGIARLFWKTRLTGSGTVLGTAEFMAAEQADGRAVDPRTDLYSVGAVLYVVLARRPLYNARSLYEMLEKQRQEEPMPLRSAAPEVPAEFEQIVHRLLEKDPDRRFATALVLERRLDDLLQSFAAPAADGDCPPAALSSQREPPDDEPALDPYAVTVASTHPGTPQASLPVGEQAAAPPKEPVASDAANPADLAESAPVAAGVGGRFVSVRPGELDRMPQSPAEPPWWRSAQIWALVAGLLAVGWLAWYLLQPPSANALYDRIKQQTSAGSSDALVQAEGDIRQFVARFPEDARGAALRDDLERIEVERLERQLDLRAKGMNQQSPLSLVEWCYVEALAAARGDADAGIEKLRAMLDLFGTAPDSDSNDLSASDRRCLELASRRLSELTRQSDQRHKEQLAAVAKRLDAADALSAPQPARAAAIRRDVLTLFESKPWAKALVERARAGKEKP